MPTSRNKDGYRKRREFSSRMQKIAIREYYPSVWPEGEITEVSELPGDFARKVDIGGGDQVLQFRDGHVVFIASRFRKRRHWNGRYKDFTIREGELDRHLAAYWDGGFLPGYYVYGFANKEEDKKKGQLANDFAALIVIDYHRWIADIAEGRLKMRLRKVLDQENFYHYPFLEIQEPYLVWLHLDPACL